MLDENDFIPTREWVLEAIKERWAPILPTEVIPAELALGRISAEDSFSTINQPVVRCSAMDGIAVRSSDFTSASGGYPDTSAWKLGHDYIRADTGDDFDDAYDSVIQVEKVKFLGNGGIELEQGIEMKAGLNVRPTGDRVRHGEILLKSHTVIRPWDIAALISGGANQIKVFKRPTVAFIPTGSELVAAGTIPTRGQAIDSNTALTSNMLHEMGAQAITFPIIKDDKAAIRSAIETAVNQADFVVINAGSSKGGEDFNAILLEEMGDVLCHWIASAPGRPMAAAIINGKPVLNVPGPPKATYFVFDWCIRKLVDHAYGIPSEVKTTIEVTLAEDVGAPPHMEILTSLRLWREGDEILAAPLPKKSGTMIEGLTLPGQLVTELGRIEPYKKGERVRVSLLRGTEV